MKNIILTDDHVIVRNGLKEVIQKLGAFKVSAQYDDGKEMIDTYPWEPDPDLILLDLNMPRMDGYAVMDWYSETDIITPVLILTLNDDEKSVTRLFRKGVRGYLHKDCTPQELKRALEDIFRTGYYHNDFLRKYMRMPDEVREPVDHSAKIRAELSDREKELLRLICDPEELTYAKIADRMGISERSVNYDREAIFQRYGVKSKTGLVLFAIKHGIYKVT